MVPAGRLRARGNGAGGPARAGIAGTAHRHLLGRLVHLGGRWLVRVAAARSSRKRGDILPCFLYTPPCLGMVPKFSSPPRTPKSYADFIDVMITRFGEYFDWVELWNRAEQPE